MFVAAFPWVQATYTTPLTTASASIQPTRNAGPFTFARDENSMRITATMASRLIATATA